MSQPYAFTAVHLEPELNGIRTKLAILDIAVNPGCLFAKSTRMEYSDLGFTSPLTTGRFQGPPPHRSPAGMYHAPRNTPAASPYSHQARRYEQKRPAARRRA